MKTPKYSHQYKQAKEMPFVDRNLIPVNPLKQQFEPKPPEPVRQRNKMGGGA